MRASGSLARVERKRGAQWYVRYRLPDGRKVQRRLGPAWTERGRPPTGHYTRKTAEAELRRILTDAERGTLASMVRTGATFADAAAEWLRYIEHDRKRRTSTVIGYRSGLQRHLMPEFGHSRLKEVTTEIDAYRRNLVADARLSARSINKLVQLHSILKRAQRIYGLAANPAAGVERQPVTRSGDFDVLSPDEVDLLAASAGSDQDAAIFTAAAFTGLRLGELRGLRWADIDFAKRLMHVRRNYTAGSMGAPKSGRVRSVPLTDRAARVLDGLSRREHFTDDEDLVFTNDHGAAIDESSLRRRYRAALKQGGLKRMRFHDLRHTFGTLAVQALPLSDVKAYMGHADIQTTMLYVHNVPRVDAAERLSRLLEGDFPARVADRVAKGADMRASNLATTAQFGAL